MRALTVYNLALLAACAALGTGAWQEIRQPPLPLPEAIAVNAPAEPAAVVASAPAFRIAPVGTFGQVITRPAFSSSRRPPRPKPPEPVAVQKPAPVVLVPVAEPQVTLVGIVIGGGKSIAMVRKAGAEELLRLGKGEELDGWQVEGVLPDRLVLSHGGKLLEFELTEAPQNAGTSTMGAGARPRRP